jgi:hypothetical protein
MALQALTEKMAQMAQMERQVPLVLQAKPGPLAWWDLPVPLEQIQQYLEPQEMRVPPVLAEQQAQPDRYLRASRF